MAPKARKDAQPVQEDFTQDVLLSTTVTSVQLNLGLLAAPAQLLPEPLSDSAAAPPLHVELIHNNGAAVVGQPAVVNEDFSISVNWDHKFKHRKGPGVIDALINSNIIVRICNSQTKALLATATVDLLPFGLGSNAIQEDALPLDPAYTDDVFKVLPGSTVALSVRLLHQPNPTPPLPMAPHSAAGHGTTSSSAGTAAQAAAAAAAAVAPPVFEPYTLITPAEAADCNVLELVPIWARPLPQQLLAAVQAASGALCCSIALHLPGSQRSSNSSSGGSVPAAVQCSSGCFEGEQLVWHKQSRAYLPPATVQALKAVLELGKPLLLEVARYLTASTDTLIDAAFSSYHALLEFQAAAEQLQEPGAVSAAGPAVALGCISWMLQQGMVPAAILPVQSQPIGSRGKPIEEAPPASPEGQAPACTWQAAGTQFMVQLRLAKPLQAPWQPPTRPQKRLADIIAPKQPPAPAPAPSATDTFRAKVQELAAELAQEYSAAKAPSSSQHLGSSSKAGPQEELVFNLNHTGRYLAMKEQLKRLLLAVVDEKYKAAGSMPGPDQVAQLHNELYVVLIDEVHRAIASTASSGPAGADSTSMQQQQQQQAWPAEADRLLQRAAECEGAGDFQRAQTLHQRRLVGRSTAKVWHEYGCFCMRVNLHVRAHAAFQEALSIDQQLISASAALICLGLAAAQGKDVVGFAAEGNVHEWVEVLGHAIKDAAGPGSGAAAWALLTLLYRMQGKPKEAQARSCHQEVVRQAKAAFASASSSASGDSTGNDTVGSAAAAPAPDSMMFTALPDKTSAGVGAANGYMAAAELALQLRLPALAGQLLELAAGLKDPTGQLVSRLKLCNAAVAQQVGDHQKALQLLRELVEQLAAHGSNTEKTLLQVLLGDVQFKAGSLNLAKQHYRRALQKAPEICSPDVYMRLGSCFMASGDAAVAADVYTSCLEGSAGAAAAPAGSDLRAMFGFDGSYAGWGTSRCASTWLGLGLAYLRLEDYRSAELALSEASLCDPEQPQVWGYLALLSLLQGLEDDADIAMQQAQRHDLADMPLLVELADKYQELGRFTMSGNLLAKAAKLQDNVQVRCKLAAVLLAQHDYQGCQEQLALAAQLPASEDDKELLMTVMRNLQVAWPHL